MLKPGKAGPEPPLPRPVIAPLYAKTMKASAKAKEMRRETLWQFANSKCGVQASDLNPSCPYRKLMIAKPSPRQRTSMNMPVSGLIDALPASLSDKFGTGKKAILSRDFRSHRLGSCHGEVLTPLRPFRALATAAS